MLEEARAQGLRLTQEQELMAVIGRQDAAKKIKDSVQRFDDFGRLVS
jgi:hypothetical protein